MVDRLDVHYYLNSSVRVARRGGSVTVCLMNAKVSGNGAQTDVMTLPVGYRPAVEVFDYANVNGADNSIHILPSGLIQAQAHRVGIEGVYVTTTYIAGPL